MLNMADYANTLLAGMAGAPATIKPAPAKPRPCLLTLVDEARDTLDAIENIWRRTDFGDRAHEDDRDDLWECAESLGDAVSGITRDIESL